MAISKILHMGCAKSGFKAKHLANTINYITKPQKTENGLYVSGHNCLPETALKQMLNTKRRYNKMGERQGYHIIISFEEAADTVNKDTAMAIIREFTEEFLGKDFEAVYALHDDAEHIHGHIVFNSVRCIGKGLKYDYRNGDWDKIIQPLVNKICEKHHMATLDMEQVRENRKKKRELLWDQGKDGKYVWNDMICRDVDDVAADAENWDEFLIGMEERGYEIKEGAHLLVKPPGMEKGRRLDTLGGEYTEERIRERLHQPTKGEERQKFVFMPPPKVKRVSGYVSRRRTKLTGCQRRYVAELYRLGVKTRRPYSNAWKYKEDIKRLHELQEDYWFLSAHQIHTDRDLDVALQTLSEQVKILRREERRQKETRESCQEVFGLWEGLQELEVEVSLFEEGYQEFKEEFDTAKKWEQELEALGYSLESIKERYLQYQDKNERIREMLAVIRKQQRIGKRILQEQKERVQGLQKKETGEKERVTGHYDL